MTIETHEPTPEFARFLEWQVTSAVRRQDRFTAPAPPAFAKYFSVAALVLVSVFVGAGGVAAAGFVQKNQEKQLLLSQQQAEIQIAELQMSLLQKSLDEARRRVSVGVADKEELLSAERELQIAQFKMARARLNVEEIDKSGRPAQDELTAPLVGGRDFVTERLQIDQRAAAVSADAAARKVQAAKTRFDVGLAGDLELLETQTSQAKALAEMSAATDLIALRSSFLSGKLKGAGVARERMLLTARSQLQVTQAALALAVKRQALFKTRNEVGTANQIDLAKAQLEVLSLQQDILRLQGRIRELQQGR